MTQKEKHNIRHKFNYAVKTGKILKPIKCSRCKGIFELKSIQAHHPDYRRPFFVKWLCKKCHLEIHKTGNTVRGKLTYTKAQLKYFKEMGKLGGQKLLKERGTEYFSKISKTKRNKPKKLAELKVLEEVIDEWTKEVESNKVFNKGLIQQ